MCMLLQIKKISELCAYFNTLVKRHFGKQMNKETKLRIHNIAAKHH